LIYSEKLLKIIDKKLGYIGTYYYLYYVIKNEIYENNESKSLRVLK
jgi:hypothetical protein